MVISTRRFRPDEGGKLIVIWCRLADAMYDSLSKAYRKELEEMVHVFLPEALLWVAANIQDQPIAFMLLIGERMDALLIDSDVHGCGAGKLLTEHVLSLTLKLTANVNKQNEQAVGFYQRMGFNATGRSETDDLG